jgi:hypothetical protein
VELAALPFYRERLGRDGRPEPWDLLALQEFAARTGDPYGGRLAPGAELVFSLQIEASEDEPLWIGLSRAELAAWSRGLERLLRLLALRAGEALAFFDFGSSPLVLLSSGNHAAHLGRGAADRLGLTTICNDGLASLVGRMTEIVRLVRPAGLVLRRDVLAPLAEALRVVGLELAETCRFVAVTEAEDAPSRSEAERYAAAWRVPVHRVLRADAAYLIGLALHGSDEFLVDPALHTIETLADGELAASARFARSCPAVRYRLGPGAVASGRDASGRRWLRITRA